MYILYVYILHIYIYMYIYIYKTFHNKFFLDGHLGIDDWNLTVWSILGTKATERQKNLLEAL